MFFKWGCVTFLEVVHRVVKNEITTQIPIAVFATSADRRPRVTSVYHSFQFWVQLHDVNHVLIIYVTWILKTFDSLCNQFNFLYLFLLTCCILTQLPCK